jgi:hypothetical protein
MGEMTDDLLAEEEHLASLMTDIRSRHHPYAWHHDPSIAICEECDKEWLCDTAQVLAALDKWKAELLELVLVRERQRDAARALADELAALLAEGSEYGEWSHKHCDTASDGIHFLDHDWWQQDAHAALAKWEASK